MTTHEPAPAPTHPRYQISVDTGGTFTDVVVADSTGRLHMAKALTNDERPMEAIADALSDIATTTGTPTRSILNRATLLTYGTTRSTNAIAQSKVARTGFFTTTGHPDILLLREGGRPNALRQQRYPDAYVPRFLTNEIVERVDAAGDIVQPLDEASVLAGVEMLRANECRALGVCLLWSIVNPTHELRIGEIVGNELPNVAITLSHELLPILREYRRASATVIDASLKPLMSSHLDALERDLREHGFDGHVLTMTSAGSAWPMSEVARQPIHSVGSGPSMAPVAATQVARSETSGDNPGDIVVCDAGGTTFDVGLAVDGRIAKTAEAWVGPRYSGHILGVQAVEINSLATGGGSLIWVDDGGMLRVGPHSAGSLPGPACYRRGGTRPTLTDAAASLGYLNADNPLGGHVRIDVDAARHALAAHISEPTGLTIEAAAAAALGIAATICASAIREITITQGVDPRDVRVVAGGGAAGLLIVPIARELGCSEILLPSTAGVLSAAGGLHSDPTSTFTQSLYGETRNLDLDTVNATLATLGQRAQHFLDAVTKQMQAETRIEYALEARYPGQIWELSIPLAAGRLQRHDLDAIEAAFHETHRRRFAVAEHGQHLECIAWSATAIAVPPKPTAHADNRPHDAETRTRTSNAYFRNTGTTSVPRHNADQLHPGTTIPGPLIVDAPTTTIVIDPSSSLEVTAPGNYLIHITSNTGGAQ